MKTSFKHTALLVLALSGASLSVTVPLAQAQTPLQNQANAGLSAEDFASCRLAFSHLNVFEIMQFGALQALGEEESLKGLSDDERHRLNGLIKDELGKRREAALTALAQANCGGYTSQQIADMVRMSRLKPLQDAMWNGVDSSLPPPDFGTLSPEEMALVEREGSSDWFTRFLTQMELTPAQAILEEGLVAAFIRFGAQ